MRPAIRFKVPIWIAVWIITRALMVALVGFWLPGGPLYQDVDVYYRWSTVIVDGGLPDEVYWQYPPGAAYVMALPRFSFEDFQPSFVALMLVVDLIGLWLLTRPAREEGRDVGVWIWLLALPLLATMASLGGLPLLRFDLVPTVIAIAALLAIHRRPAWFGALAGIGAAIKVWPLFLLFGEWERKRLRRSALAAALSVAAIFAITAVFLGNPFGFLDDQGGRGLQVESVAALPWKLTESITGEGQHVEARYGSNEIDSGVADGVADALDFAALAVLVAAAVWWHFRERRIREGRLELSDVALSRDFIFAVCLLFVVVSRVLSPQYMIWMVGLSAVVLSSRHTRIARAAWLTVAATVLTAGISQPLAITLVTRNLVLLYAAIDAAAVLTAALAGSRGGRRASASEPEPVGSDL
jgi:hypothetical protein